jgi:tetratricopeptide (TPR) repeat protein
LAYHFKGDGFKSLQDANKCLALDPYFVKAYSREAEALHNLKRFKEAKAIYEEGLDKFPGDEYLSMGLENLMAEYSVTRSARGRRACVVASMSAQRNSKEAQSISEFVVFTRTKLELEIAGKQAQLRIINELAKKSDDDKRKLLFNLLDQDDDGYLSAQELADGVRKNNESRSRH